MTGTRKKHWVGAEYAILLHAEETQGRIGMFESVDAPGFGPPRHVHDNEDETFHILAGEVEFWVSGERRVAQPGDTLFVPRGTEHTFRIIGDHPARMLTIMTPGGFEGFFVEVMEGEYAIPRDMDAITAIGRRYNMRFTGPPLGEA